MPDDGTDPIVANGDLLQVLVELGKELDRHVALAPFGGRRRMPPSERPASLARIAALEEALDERVHRDGAAALRRSLRVRRDEAAAPDMMRALAVVAHRQLLLGRCALGVGATARVAALDDTARSLDVRRAIRTMIVWELLAYADGNLGDGDLRLGRRAVRGLSGDGLDVVWTAESLKRDIERGTVDDQVRALNRRAAERERMLAMASLAQGDAPPPAGSLPPNASARQIFEALRRTLVGMDKTIMEFAAAMASHSRRVEMIRAGHPVESPVKTVLLVGSSGSGKTALAQQFAKVCGYRSVVVDLTQVTSSGYVGESVSDAFETLWTKAGGPAGMVGGVCIWDELDKRASNRGAIVDVAGKATQQELLKVIEASGTDYRVGGRNSFSALRGTFDPSSLCHIFCGAFTGLADLARRRLGRSKSIGFGGPPPNAGGRTDIRSLLNEYGLLQELTNRIQSVILMPHVTMETLLQIATAPNGIIAQQNRFTASSRLKLLFTEAAVREVCGWALATETVARGIRSVVGRLGDEAMAEERTGEVRIDATDVRRAIEADGEALLGL